MAYLGNQPLSGSFKKLDNISGSFNGSTQTFNLNSGGTAVYPQAPGNLIISMNGVLQEPGVAYTISGQQITFPEAPVAGETFFGVLLGDVGFVPVVQDGQVTPTKLSFSPALLSANTFTGNQTGGDNQLVQWNARDIGAVFVDKGTVASGTSTLDYTGGNVQRIQVGGAMTIAFSNWPASGNQGTMMLELVNGGSATVTWPTVNWVLKNGTFTTTLSTYLSDFGRTALQTSGTDFFVFWTRNAGTTIYGKLL